MPIDEGVNVDVQFLILEVKKQAAASLSYIENPTPKKLTKIHSREDYINNLKNTLENKSYYNIHQHTGDKRQMNGFRALITIASNLERCADFFERIAEQITYAEDVKHFDDFNLRVYYKVVYQGLDIIYPALVENDLDLAQKICDYEQELDNLYASSFKVIRANLRQRKQVDDMLCLLFIIRYLERVGDSFLNIGEAILDIHVGEKMGIKQFRHLRKGLESQDIDISSANVEFKPVMNTRSGSRVAKINRLGPNKISVFYKEGERKKIDQEVEGLNLWHSLYPDMTPAVLWHNSRRQHSTIILEYIEGDELLEVLIKKRTRAEQCLKLLNKTLSEVWQSSIKAQATQATFVKQLLGRRADVKWVHDNLFDREENIDDLLAAAKKMEEGIQSPFSTILHGDLNIDNILFSKDAKKMHFIDVHRSTYGDYAQDVSVFLVSTFRVPVFSQDIRQQLDKANLQVFKNAQKFARKNQDNTFEARLALGLFRSLITSTRFLFDKNFSEKMFERAILILQQVLARQDRLDKFKLKKELFLHG